MFSGFLWHRGLGVWRGWVDLSLPKIHEKPRRKNECRHLSLRVWLSSRIKLCVQLFDSPVIRSPTNIHGVRSVCQTSFWVLGRRQGTSHSEEATAELRSQGYAGARRAKIWVLKVPGSGNSKGRLRRREKA